MQPQNRMKWMRELVHGIQYLVRSQKISIASCCNVLVRPLWKRHKVQGYMDIITTHLVFLNMYKSKEENMFTIGLHWPTLGPKVNPRAMTILGSFDSVKFRFKMLRFAFFGSIRLNIYHIGRNNSHYE